MSAPKETKLIIVNDNSEKRLDAIAEADSGEPSKTLQTNTTTAAEDDEYSNWEKRDKKKQELLRELKPVLNVSSQIKLFRALKSLLENLCILLVWFSCIYK